MRGGSAQEAATQSKKALGRDPPVEKCSSKPCYEDSCMILSFQPKPRRWRWTSWKKPRRSGPRWVWTSKMRLFYLACGFVPWLDRRQVSTSSSSSTCLWHAAKFQSCKRCRLDLAEIWLRLLSTFSFFFFFLLCFFAMWQVCAVAAKCPCLQEARACGGKTCLLSVTARDQ